MIDAEIRASLDGALSRELFRDAYDVFHDPGPDWGETPPGAGPVFRWDPGSMVLRRPPFLDEAAPAGAIVGARILLLLGDEVTTDHISSGGSIPADTEAGAYLIEHGIVPARFGSYVGRRANHEVMVRGTFANTRPRNEMVQAGKAASRGTSRAARW